MRCRTRFMQMSFGSKTHYGTRNKQCTTQAKFEFFKPAFGVSREANPGPQNDVCGASSAMTQFCGAISYSSGDPASFWGEISRKPCARPADVPSVLVCGLFSSCNILLIENVLAKFCSRDAAIMHFTEMLTFLVSLGWQTVYKFLAEVRVLILITCQILSAYLRAHLVT